MDLEALHFIKSATWEDSAQSPLGRTFEDVAALFGEVLPLLRQQRRTQVLLRLLRGGVLALDAARRSHINLYSSLTYRNSAQGRRAGQQVGGLKAVFGAVHDDRLTGT